MDSGYWQVVAELEARSRLAFFTPTGKKQWKVMPMGALNSAATFVAMMTKLQVKWDEIAEQRGIQNAGSKVIVDDILLYAETADSLLSYFRCFLEVLVDHRATINLRKCKWFRSRCEFVGIDVTPEGNQPAQSKYHAFQALNRPETWYDLRMIIGFFGFYAKFMPLYETRIQPFRLLLSKQPKPGSLSPDDERKLMTTLWQQAHDTILAQLKNDIIAGPVLARPDPSRRFYLKMDWSKEKMGAVLLQADTTPPAQAAETRERNGGRCEFDRTKSGIRLRPLAFIDRITSASERSYHSYVGEVAAGRWAIGKFYKFLYGSEFTWLTDCSSVQHFMTAESRVDHRLQCWKAELSQFAFTVEHRPALMLTECDTLSRYNTTVNTWRETNPTADLALTASPQATNLSLSPPPCLSVLLTMRPPRFLGTPVGPTAPQDHLRTTLASGALTVPLSNAYLAAGISPQSISYIDFLSNDLLMLPPTDYASKHQPAPVWLDAFGLNIDIGPPLDWFIAFYTPALADPPALQPVTGKTDEDFLSWRNQHLQLARSLISKCGTRAVILATPRTCLLYTSPSPRD